MIYIDQTGNTPYCTGANCDIDNNTDDYYNPDCDGAGGDLPGGGDDEGDGDDGDGDNNGGGGGGNDQTAEQIAEDILKSLKSYLAEGKYTDLQIMQFLILEAMARNGDPLIAFKALNMVLNEGIHIDPFNANYEFDKTDDYYYDPFFTGKNKYDNSGFGDLADVSGPANQITHFIGEAYIAYGEMENKGIEKGTNSATWMVWANELKNSNAGQSKVDRDLGYIAIDFAKNLHEGMNAKTALTIVYRRITTYTLSP